MNQEYLSVYINDQLAANVAWRELARRAQRSNRGTPLGDTLAEVVTALEQDVETLRGIMGRLGISHSRIKPALAMAAERAGRLKLNGALRAYSPLSRFAELDTLCLGIEGKRQLWENLREFVRINERLPDIDIDALIARAERQRALLEPHRRATGAEVFGGVAADEDLERRDG